MRAGVKKLSDLEYHGCREGGDCVPVIVQKEKFEGFLWGEQITGMYDIQKCLKCGRVFHEKRSSWW